MKLVHVVPAIAQEASGPSYSVRRLCDALVAEGADVTLAALDWAQLADRPAYLRTFPLGLGPPRLGRSPVMYRWLKSAVERNGVRLIHNHGMWQMNAVYPGWVVKGGKTALMVSPRGALTTWAMAHGSRFKKLFWPLFQRPTLLGASCFHATSDREYADIRRLGFAQPVAIIPNGIDLPPPRSHSSNGSHQRTLLFLGRIHKVKGLELLLKAWARLEGRHSEWRLRVAGSDAGYYGSSGYLAELQLIARNLGLDRIEFAGQLRGNEKWHALAAAELFVLPSYSENFAVAVAEALASGTPAVVTRGAPWSGLAERGVGWWVDVSADALASALDEAMCKTPEALEEMGARGRRWMAEDFSWEVVGRRMLETYEWMLSAGGRPPSWVRTD